MIKKVKTGLLKRLREEKGQALIMVLALLMIGSLTLPPVLSHISTALKTGQVYKSKTDELYAADSGIEDALWQIQYDRLAILFSEPAYDTYDYSTVWSYSLSEPINNLTANVSIQNVWIPKDVTPLSPAEARSIIESNKLMVAGTAPGGTSYQIKVNFYPDEGEEDDLKVNSLGIWLPLGFHYAGNCNLEDDPGSDNYSESVTDYAGGEAIVWTFSPPVDFSSVGDFVDGTPMTTDITFGYTSDQPGDTPTTISWMVTSGVSDVPLSWDIDTRIFKVTSAAGDIQIEAYASRCELRKMGAAIAGDYRAVGNSLMIDGGGSPEVRDELLDSSDAEISDIPSSADVIAAFLYWSGWLAAGTPMWQDDCSNFGEWIAGSCWNIDSGHFRSHYSSGPQSTRYCTMKDSLDLSSYPSGSVRVGWTHWEEWDWQLEPDDALIYQFSGDGGNSWSANFTAFADDLWWPVSYIDTIPDEYKTNNFKFRFNLEGFGGDDEYCYVDDFFIAEFKADESVIFKINGDQVYLDGGVPEIDPFGIEEITATESSILDNDYGFSYACNLDVTSLVKAFSDLGDEENHTGNGEYTVGSVDATTGDLLSYAGWSLIVIYSSPETAGHQLYLYDDFAFNGGNENLDFDDDGEPGGIITGFVVPDPPEDLGQYPNAATLTCFVGDGDYQYYGDYLRFNGTKLSDGEGSLDNVWDSKSIGMEEEGVDIDTFYVTWASGLLEAGATTAQLDMVSGWPDYDHWNLIYIILSFRSETVTGSTVHYVIHGT